MSLEQRQFRRLAKVSEASSGRSRQHLAGLAASEIWVGGEKMSGHSRRGEM